MVHHHALIVDDSSTARIMLSRMLHRIDMTSDSVESAEAALEYLQKNSLLGKQPDVIFLDHLLPGMDGFQALREIKRLPYSQSIPVFMYTSQHAERYREEALALGAAGVIGKQIDRNRLSSMLEAILARQHDHDVLTEPVMEAAPDPQSSFADPELIRKLTGRLATLEIAYEESSEELRHLRQELTRIQVQDIAQLDRRTRRLRWISLALSALIAGSLLFYWQRFGDLIDRMSDISFQYGNMVDIVAKLLELLGR